MSPRLIFWLPRISSIVISFFTVAFLSEVIVSQSVGRNLVAIVVTVVGFAAVARQALRSKNDRIWTLLPLCMGFGFVILFFLGGFTASLGIIRFVFLLTLAALPTLLSYYSWNNTWTGGLLYIVAGVFYLILGFRRISLVTSLLVTGFFIQTGFLLINAGKKPTDPAQSAGRGPTNPDTRTSTLPVTPPEAPSEKSPA